MRSETVTLSGELDLSMRAAVDSALPQPTGLGRLVVDCTAVTSIESVVIAVFMRYRRKWIAAGGDPLNIVFIVTPSLRRMFEIAGMSEWFTIVSSDRAAGAMRDLLHGRDSY